MGDNDTDALSIDGVAQAAATAFQDFEVSTADRQRVLVTVPDAKTTSARDVTNLIAFMHRRDVTDTVQVSTPYGSNDVRFQFHRD